MEQGVRVYRPEMYPEKEFIRQIWRIKDTVPVARTEKILPKGTAEIIFNLSEGAVGFTSQTDKSLNLPICFVNGVNLAPISLSVSDKQYFIGIQVNTFALNYIFGIPAVEFNSQVLDGDLVCSSLQDLANKLAETSSFNAQAETILSWFRKKISGTENKESFKRISGLNSDPGLLHLSVKEIGAKYNATPRHIRRLCTNYFGMSTEALVLYRRYLSALHQVHGQQQSLTQIAYDSGFFDQAHFTRTFKLFTGHTPRQYKASKGDLPGHLFSFGAEPLLEIIK